jgi:hypothetical protein
MPGGANSPCITNIAKSNSAAPPARYYTSRICITAPIVSKGDGELTVFHTCSTIGTNIPDAISVFALRTSSHYDDAQPQPIDKIISAAEARVGMVSLDLAEYTTYRPLSANAVLSNGNNCTVWLHNREIMVNCDFTTFGGDSSTIYTSAPLFVRNSSLIEGLSSDDTTAVNGLITRAIDTAVLNDIYADDRFIKAALATHDSSKIYSCEYLPIDDDDDKVTTYEIPINSKLISQSQIGASAEIISTMTLVVVLFIFTFMIAPIIYPLLRSAVYGSNNIVNDKVSKEMLNGDIIHMFSRLVMPHIYDKGNANNLLNITNMGTKITIVVMVLSFILLILGGASNNLSVILGGLYLLVIIMVAVLSNTFFSVLQINKAPIL